MVGEKVFLPEDDYIEYVTTIFKALSNPLRIKIVLLLMQSPLPVYIIERILGKEQSLISHNLKTLLKANIISYKDIGRYRMYYFNEEGIPECIVGMLREILKLSEGRVSHSAQRAVDR